VKGYQHIKVVEVRSLNLNLDLLWKYLGMKLGENIKYYKTLILSNFQKKRICFVRVMSLWKLCVRFGFLVISPLFELFWIYSFGIIKEYICERNFMSFGFILREIQAFKVSILVLESIPFESDNSLRSTSIELKFWADIENIYLMCLPNSLVEWKEWLTRWKGAIFNKLEQVVIVDPSADLCFLMFCVLGCHYYVQGLVQHEQMLQPLGTLRLIWIDFDNQHNF